MKEKERVSEKEKDCESTRVRRQLGCAGSLH